MFASAATEHRHLRNRVNGRQSLATKAHGLHGLQIVERGDFAGGVAFERQRQLIAGDATAVILHRNQAHTPRHQAQGDVCCACV